jgi:hypothetical protein
VVFDVVDDLVEDAVGAVLLRGCSLWAGLEAGGAGVDEEEPQPSNAAQASAVSPDG